MPAAADIALARGVAGRIVSLEGPRVQRVVMIGSRALGTARPDSDLDLVVLVEPPAGTPPWRSADFAAEGARLRGRIGATALPLDLWVRTTDRFAEASGVMGGVEWLAAREGMEVYGRPPSRPARFLLTREQVRCQNVSAWVEHACSALDAAHRLGNAAAVSGLAPNAGEAAAAAGLACARAVTAVLVAHQLHVPARAGLGERIEHLSRADPQLAGWLRPRVRGDPALPAALEVLRLVVARLSGDARVARYLSGPRERLSRPLVILG